MTMRIYADFQNLDPDGRIRLNTAGTQNDLKKLGIELRAGLKIHIYEDDLEADGVVEYSATEAIWVAKVVWSEVHDTR